LTPLDSLPLRNSLHEALEKSFKRWNDLLESDGKASPNGNTPRKSGL